MGAYLFYRTTNPKDARKYNAFILGHELHAKLRKKYDVTLCVNDEDDITWAHEQAEIRENFDLDYWLTYFTERLGKGELKTSGQEFDDEFYEIVTLIFILVNKKFAMKYKRRSCSWNGYFTSEQKKLITLNGKLLSGKE